MWLEDKVKDIYTCAKIRACVFAGTVGNVESSGVSDSHNQQAQEGEKNWRQHGFLNRTCHFEDGTNRVLDRLVLGVWVVELTSSTLSSANIIVLLLVVRSAK